VGIEVASLKARVKASGLFGQVQDVLSLADAMRNPGSFLKTAFVVLPKETAEPGRRDGGPKTQRVSTRICVAFTLAAQRAAGERSDEVEALRSTIKRHMMGWQPTGAETALDYAYSDISQTVPGFIWVNLFFDCKYIETEEAVT